MARPRNRANQPEDNNETPQTDTPAELQASAEVVLGVDHAEGPDATGVAILKVEGEEVRILDLNTPEGASEVAEMVGNLTKAVDALEQIVDSEKELAQLAEVQEVVTKVLFENKGEIALDLEEALEQEAATIMEQTPDDVDAKIKVLSAQASATLTEFGATGNYNLMIEYQRILAEIRALRV